MSEKTGGSLVYAADLGGTHLRAALIDETGRIHSHLKHSTPIGTKPDLIVDALVDGAEDLRSSSNLPVIFASIMVPGTIDKQNRTVVQAPNLPSLNNFGLKAVLSEKLNLPVILENDANAAAVGEMWLGAARGACNIICITLGTGVGGGIILDGKLWRGTDGSAGELGHTSVDPFGGVPCKCGSIGCLEVYASATGIVRMTREALANHVQSKLRDECLTAEKIYEAAIQGDELALEIFREVGIYLGIGLANLINALGPEVIVIGGGVANAWQLFIPSLSEEINRRAFSSIMKTITIKPAECGDNAGLLGAARLAFDSDFKADSNEPCTRN